jgi:hypothetical protein
MRLAMAVRPSFGARITGQPCAQGTAGQAATNFFKRAEI